MGVSLAAFSSEVVKIAAEDSSRSNYLKAMAAAAPVVAVQSAMDFPEGWIESAVEKRLRGPGSPDKVPQGWRRAVGRAGGRMLAGTTTAPLFYSALRQVKDAKTKQERNQGIAKVLGAGALFSALRAGIEIGGEGLGGMPKPDLIKKIRNVAGLRTAMGIGRAGITAATVAGLLKHEEKKGKPTPMTRFVIPAIYGAGLGAAGGAVEEVAEKGFKSLTTPQGLRGVGAKAGARGVSGVLGTLVLSEVARRMLKEKKASDKNWVAEHPDASNYVMPLYARTVAMGATDPVGAAVSVAESRAPSIRYAYSRSSSQRWSNKALLEEIEKIPKAKWNTPYARAYFDEARDRKLGLPAGAPGKATPKEPPSTLPSLLGGVAGSLVLGGLAGKAISTSDSLAATDVGKKLLEKAKKEKIPVVFADVPPHYGFDHVVRLPENTHASVLAHELGHASGDLGKKVLQRMYVPSKVYGMTALPALSVYGVAARGDTSLEDSPKAARDRLQNAQVLMGAATLPYTPVLAEEARASGRALKMIKDLDGWKGIPGAAGRLGVAYGTYLMGAAAPAIGIAQLQRKKKKLDKQIAKAEKLEKVSSAQVPPPTTSQIYADTRDWAQAAPEPEVQRKYSLLTQNDPEKTPTRRAVYYALHDDLTRRGAQIPPPPLRDQVRGREGAVTPPGKGAALAVAATVSAPSLVWSMGINQMPPDDRARVLADALDRAHFQSGDFFRVLAQKDSFGGPVSAYEIGTNRIHLSDNPHPEDVAHEIGHAQAGGLRSKTIGSPGARSAYAVGSSLSVVVPIMALVSASDRSFTTRQDLESQARFVKAVGAVSTLLMSPVLAEEAAASATAVKLLRDAGASTSEAVTRGVKRLAPALATYAAPAAAPLLAAKILKNRAESAR